MSENYPQQPAPGDSTQPPVYQQPSFAQQVPGAYPQGQQFPGGYPAAPAQDPGKVMGIISIVLPFVGFGLIGLILGFVAKSKSKKAGFKNTPALVGIILSALAIVVTIVGLTIGIVAAAQFASDIQQQCSSGSPTFTLNGQTGACPVTK